MQSILQDLRYGLRILFKNPGFTAIAIITLGLAIGANTAIFSVVNAVLLRPLPFQDAERLVKVSIIEGKEEGTGSMSPADFLDYRDENQAFDYMAAYIPWGVTLVGEGDPERLSGALVSATFFSLLNAQAITGRTFLPEDDKLAAQRAIVLSYGLWQRRFASNPNVVGNAITLNGESFTIVGVMPRDFRFPNKTELWGLPRRIVPELPFNTGGDILQLRGLQYLNVIARLKKGVSLEQAQTQMEGITARLREQFPQENSHKSIKLAFFQDYIVRGIKPALLLLLVVVGLVLLIACANIANMLLVKSTARQKEFAIRTALGASQVRLVRQLLTESILLAISGGALGLLLAIWGTDLLVAVSPTTTPRAQEINLDSTVLGFTVAVSLAAGILFGLAPVAQSFRLSLTDRLKEGSLSIVGGWRNQRMRSLLIVTEVAISLVLLVGAGLLLKSFLRLQQVNPGFSPESLLTMRMSLTGTRYETGRQRATFYHQLVDRIKALPGVQAAGGIESLPIEGRGAFYSFSIEGRPAPASPLDLSAGFHSATPGYFQTMGTPFLKGRDFTERDDENATNVVIVNETFARKFFSEEDALGKRVSFGTNDSGDPNWLEIVGVVGDIKHVGLETEAEPETYVPYLQTPYRFITIIVRAATEPASLVAAIRKEALALDPQQPLYDVKPMEQVLEQSIAERRLIMLLLSIFAAVALALAAVGLYGVMSYSITQRTREIGIRMALGAKASDVLKIVIKHGMVMVLIGVAIGLAAAFILTRLMASLLYGVSATDPTTFVVIPLFLLAVALMACLIPARRATKIEAVAALRHE